MYDVLQLSKWVKSLSQKKKYALAFALGCSLTLAFPPFWILPALVIAFTGWILLLEKAGTQTQAWLMGWWFGFGHFTTGMYWITIALGIDEGQFLWVVPLALIVLPAYLALFPACVAIAFHRAKLPPFERLLVLAVCWCASEYARATLMGGYPWNLLGYVWTISDITLQPAALFGVYGLGIWAVIFGGAASLFTSHPRDKKHLYGVAAVFLLFLAWGGNRLLEHPPEAGKPATLRIVQANIAQELKWDQRYEIEALKKHLDLSQQGWRDPNTGHMNPTSLKYIVWPETAMPFPFLDNSNWAHVLGSAVPFGGMLLTGVVRTEGQGDAWRVWNSLEVVNHEGRVIGVYDKTKLVPFGEFLPFRSWLGFLPLNKVTQGSTDFSEGRGAVWMQLGVGGPQIQPLICYETIFPSYQPSSPASNPSWMLNITNDAWFGYSTGPFQHFHMARTRAVERGIPLVRAANSGISGVFDAYGRVIASLDLGKSGILDVAIPAIISEGTLYSHYGNIMLLIIAYILLLYAFRVRTKTA